MKQPCNNCREIVEELQEEIRQLRETAYGGDGFLPPFTWGLTPTEAIILQAVTSRPVATRDFIFQSLEAKRPGYEAEPKIIDVFICKMRNKLRGFGIDIQTRWGVGYMLEDDQRAAVLAACEGRGGANVGPALPGGDMPRPIMPHVLDTLEKGPATMRDLSASINTVRPGTSVTAIQTAMNRLAARGEVRFSVIRTSSARRPTRIWSLVPQENAAAA